MKFWSRVLTAAAGVALGLSVVSAQAATPTPSPKVPSAPRSLTASANDTRVALSWSAPATVGTGIDNYQVNTNPADFPRTYTGTATSLTATGLHNGTKYTFTVRAHNAAGWGPAGFVFATPHAFPPGPPTGVAATPGPADGQYTLSWSPPTSTGSSPNGTPPTIDHYTVTISPSAACQMIDPNSSCIASNIPDNVTSTFSVTATNSRSVTGPAATVYAPLPTGANIGLAPTAGVTTTSISATGQLFLANEKITLYWDIPSHVAASVVTDANGSFAKTVKPFAGDKPKVHKLCASVQPKPCANFSLQPPPTPTAAVTPSPDESPSPGGSPQASGPRTGHQTGGGGLSGLDIITRPPFVFLPIIGILGLLGVLAFWALSGRRRPPAPAAATVVHRATRPDYTTPFPPARTPGAPGASIQPPGAAPPGAAAQPAWQAPVQPIPQPQAPVPQPPRPVQPPVQPPAPAAAPPAPPAAPQAPPAPAPGPVEWPAPPSWAATPDEPPDLPQPSD
jgi:fibronectin type III domain protein